MSLFQRQLTRDEDEYAGTFQQQALEIFMPGENFDPSRVPTSGEEFLSYMAYERKNTPAVISRLPTVKKLKTETTNDIEPPFIASIKTDQECAAHGLDFLTQSKTQRCTKEWKEMQLVLFKTTRSKAHALRNEKFYISEIATSTEPIDWLQFCSTKPPLLNEALTLGQRDLENLLEAICDWMQRSEEVNGINNANEIDTNATNEDSSLVNFAQSEFEQNFKVTTPWIGQWLYATLVCLNLPLEPDVHSTMREIVRILVRQRARFNPTAGSEQHINTYNIFIHIIATFFGQLDFAEFV